MQQNDGLVSVLTSVHYNLSKIRKGTEAEQIEGANGLALLSREDGVKEHIIDVDGIVVLLSHLDHINTDIQKQLTRLLFNLSVLDKGRAVIVENNGLQVLLNKFNASREHSSICINIMGTLANLVIQSENKIPLVNMGILPVLMDILKVSECESLLAQSCRAIFGLASRNSIKGKLVALGLLHPLIRCLSYSTKIQVHAAGAIANIAIGKSGKSEIVERGGLAPLCMLMMHSSNSQVLQQVTRTFFALAANEYARGCIVKADMIPHLVKLVRHESAMVQHNVAATIANIALTEEFRLVIVNKYKIFEPLLHLVNEIPKQNNAVTQASRALFNLSSVPVTPYHSSNTNPGSEIFQCGVQPFIALLESPVPNNAKMHGAGIIANIIAQDSRNCKELVRLGVVPLLIRLLRHAEFCVQKQAARAIANIAVETEHISQIIQAGALIPLINIMSSEQMYASFLGLQCQACRALSNLASGEMVPASIVQNGALPLLTELSMSPNMKVQQHAICCMKRLGILHVQHVMNDRVPTLQLLCENMLGDHIDTYAHSASHNLPTILQTTTRIHAPRLQAKCLLYCMEHLLHPKDAWQHDIAKHFDPTTSKLIQHMGKRWGFDCDTIAIQTTE